MMAKRCEKHKSGERNCAISYPLDPSGNFGPSTWPIDILVVGEPPFLKRSKHFSYMEWNGRHSDSLPECLPNHEKHCALFYHIITFKKQREKIGGSLRNEGFRV
jgi:hypothetical protein